MKLHLIVCIIFSLFSSLFKTPLLFAQENSGNLDYRGEWTSGTTHSHLRKDHQLNPENQLFDFKTRQNQITLDLEMDWYGSENLRFHGRGLAQYQDDNSGIKRTPALLAGNLQYEIVSGFLFVDAGKVLEEWGSGFSFNPVNILLPPKISASPLMAREGATLFKVEALLDNFALAVMLAGAEDGSTAKQEFILPDNKNRRRFAFKFDHVLGETDFSWVHVQGGLNAHEVQNQLNGDPQKPQMMNPLNGVSWTTVFGSALELHGEFATQRRRHRLIPQQAVPAQKLPDGAVIVPAMFVYAEDEKNKNQNYAKILLGGQYTFSNDCNLMLELYHDQNGYDSGEWQKIQDGINSAKINDAWYDSRFSGAQGNVYSVFLQRTMLFLQQSGFRKNYGFLRLDSGEFGERLQSESLVLANLDDAGFIFRESLNLRRGENWKFALEWTTFQGGGFSEFGLSPFRNSLGLEADYMF